MRKTRDLLTDSPYQRFVAARGIRVDISSLQGAGLGAFAKVDLPKQRVIGWYHGMLLSKAELDQKYGDQLAPYVLQLNAELYIDASETLGSNFARYINDGPTSGKKPNVEFTEWGGVCTLRNIKAGEELLTSYGSVFWDCPGLQ